MRCLSIAVLAAAFLLHADAATSQAVPASPDDGGPRNWTVTRVSTALNLRAEPSVSAPVLARYPAGTILDNLGCRAAEGRAWCDVQELGGGPRGFVAAEYLDPAVSPNGMAMTGPDDSALRAGQGEFDASGPLPCAQSEDEAMGQCDFQVARAGGGYATVVISLPDGRSRMVFYRMGVPIGVSSSEADPVGEFAASREGDDYIVRIGSERYRIPDAVVLGG